MRLIQRPNKHYAVCSTCMFFTYNANTILQIFVNICNLNDRTNQIRAKLKKAKNNSSIICNQDYPWKIIPTSGVTIKPT